jgi:hypothetical protein
MTVCKIRRYYNTPARCAGKARRDVRSRKSTARKAVENRLEFHEVAPGNL